MRRSGGREISACVGAHWTSRIGFIVPASNGVVEYEVCRMLPEGMSAHFARAPHIAERKARLAAMISSIPQMARDLVAADVDTICFACTTGSFSQAGYADRALSAIRQAGCQHPSTTTTAVFAATKALGIKRLAIISPYPDEYNQLLRGYFESRGLVVGSLSSLYSETPDRISPETVRDFCLRHADKSADGMFVSCTKLRTLEIIEDLEAELGQPVFSSIGASFWHLVGQMKLPGSPFRPGRIFELEAVSTGPVKGRAYQEDRENE